MSDSQEEHAKTSKTLKPNHLGTAALVLGIICFVLAFIPFLDYGSGFIGLIGLVLGLVGLIGKGKGKKIAVAGFTTSLVAIILSIVMAVTYTSSFVDSINKTEAAQAKDASTPITINYSVTGDSTDATITYSTFTNNQWGEAQSTNQMLPFTKTVVGRKGSDFTYNSYTLDGMNGTTGTNITCTITINGKVVATQTSSGEFASATCNSNN